MQTIKLNFGYYTKTYTEDELTMLISNKYIIDEIIIMLLRNENEFANSNEVDFTREEAYQEIEEYFSKTNFDNNYIKESIEIHKRNFNKVIKSI